MAENELLDIKGRRWRETRRYLSGPEAEAFTIADHAAEECEAGLRRDLHKFFREGTSLLLVLRAAAQDSAAMRSTIEAFKNKQIARIIRYAIQQCGPPYEARRVAELASNRLVELVIDKVGAYAASLPNYEQRTRREELEAALSHRFHDLRPTISTLLEHSLKNIPLKPPQRKPRPQSEPISVRTTALLGTSLLGSRPGRHDPAKPH
jgi:hypothetical protein